jgi:hypothetical protein
MCDYMYYEHEHKQRAKARNLLPEEPELEKAEEQPPMVIKS